MLLRVHLSRTYEGYIPVLPGSRIFKLKIEEGIIK